MFFGWLLAFLVFVFAIEDSGTPFTWYWVQECLLKGDWIPTLLFSTVLAACEGHFVRRRLLDMRGPDESSA